MKLKLLACWWCCGRLTHHTPRAEDCKETSAVSEPTPQAVEGSRAVEEQYLTQLRTQVQTLLGRQQATAQPPSMVEEVVVGVDYLPVYLERAGRLKFNGIKVKITFTEQRLKHPEELG